MAKITIIGAGRVGSSAAQQILQKNLGDVVLVDIVDGLAKGIALDLSAAISEGKINSKITGTTNYEQTKNSDIVIVTAGFQRTAEMSRDELLLKNGKIIKSIVQETKKRSPNAIYIIVTNPLDAMAYLTYKIGNFKKNRVIGMAGVLDTMRFKYFLADELKVSADKIDTLVLGGHGEDMLPLIKYTKVNGKNLEKILPESKISEIIEQTRNAGAEVISLMKSSAFYSPATAIALMAESILKDKKIVLPCSAFLEGEYGLKDIFIGVPVKLGKKGAEKIAELKLSSSEAENLNKSAKRICSLIEIMKNNNLFS